MISFQQEIDLRPRERGFHLVTREILDHLPAMGEISIGLAHLFIKHTSASLCLNENADPTVRLDFESAFNTIVPESAPYYLHNYEGPDDMPAHIKAALLGSSITLPVTGGQFNLGTWQGIYLCEHRNRGGSRRVVVTCFGQ